MEIKIKLDSSLPYKNVVDFLKEQPNVQKIKFIDDSGKSKLIADRETIKSVSLTSSFALKKFFAKEPGGIF